MRWRFTNEHYQGHDERLSSEVQVKLNGLAMIENSRNPLFECLAGSASVRVSQVLFSLVFAQFLLSLLSSCSLVSPDPFPQPPCSVVHTCYMFPLITCLPVSLAHTPLPLVYKLWSRCSSAVATSAEQSGSSAHVMSPERRQCTAQVCLTFLHTAQRMSKRDASAQVIGCPADAPAQATEGPGDASAPAHATEGLGDVSDPAHATAGLSDASAPAHATEGLGDPSAPVPGLKAFQGFSERLVLVLVPKPCDEGFEDEPPSEHVPERFKDEPPPERFKERLVLILASETGDEGFEYEPPPDPVPEQSEEKLVLILASEPRDKRFEEESFVASKGSPGSVPVSEGPAGSVPVSEGPVGSVPVSEGPVGSVPVSKGPVGSVPVSEGPVGSVAVSGGLPGTASASEGSPGTVKAKPDSKPLEFHKTVSAFVACLLHSCSVTTSFLANLQVPANTGLHGLYYSGGLLVFAFANVAGRHGLYVSAGLLVFAFANVAGRHGLYVSAGLLVFAFAAVVSLHIFAANRPGLCVVGPGVRLTFVPPWGDILVSDYMFIHLSFLEEAID
ncbi:hypothetical protein CRENBAI_021585 [Crenichthys baileyi]|uniref:Transmembrane protein n=1 Tax=Crenichthys baileyi TaxID=28760 RepID=A0AAV9SNN5_9TELE